MSLKDLQKPITYQWRVQSFSKYKPSATCVAYIDARDVMDVLDEVCGPDQWQDDYKQVDGKLLAGIGIRCQVSDKGWEWVWKWDTGSESNIEKEKGEISDSFKRAAVKWGVGRFLYSLPVKTVAANEVKKDGNFPYVVDANGNRVWDLTAHLNGTQPTTQPITQPSTPKPTVQTAPTQSVQTVKQPSSIPNCPQCGGPMWDNRTNKKNPKAPDFKCQEKVKPCKDASGKWAFGMWEEKEEPSIQQDEEINIEDIPFN